MLDLIKARITDDVSHVGIVVLRYETVRQHVDSLVTESKMKVGGLAITEVGADGDGNVVSNLIGEVRPAQSIRRVHPDTAAALRCGQRLSVVMGHDIPFGGI